MLFFYSLACVCVCATVLGSESILGSTETIEVRDEDGKSILYGAEKMGDSYHVASWMLHCIRSVQLLMFFFCVCMLPS